MRTRWGTAIDDVIRPNTPTVDASGAFPRAAISALGEAGILGLTVGESVGGGGRGLGQAAGVVRELAVCGSTAV